MPAQSATMHMIMSLPYDPRAFTAANKQRAVTSLLDGTRPTTDYVVLLVGAILLAIGGIFTDSIPVLIACMIVAPLAGPILGLGLGMAAGSMRLMRRAGGLLLGSCVVALTLGVVGAEVLGSDRVPNILISFNGNTTIAVGVAVVSGAIAAYGSMRPKVAQVATGIAIAVSLMPPLVATGVSLAPGGTPYQGALRLFLLNVGGILASSTLVFLLFGLGRVYRRHER